MIIDCADGVAVPRAPTRGAPTDRRVDRSAKNQQTHNPEGTDRDRLTQASKNNKLQSDVNDDVAKDTMSDVPYQTKRVNIQLSLVLKEQVEEYAARNGESASEFFRRGAEERILRIDQEKQDRILKHAYLEMNDSKERSLWENADLERWE